MEPNIRFAYHKMESWGRWEFSSDYNYFYGWGFAGPSYNRGVTPEGWQVSNEIKAHYRLYKGLSHAESLFAKIQRVDIGGDISPSLGTSHYYEFGLGVLLNTQKVTNLVDNIGIGLNINVGSNLSGGSLVIYFNEL